MIKEAKEVDFYTTGREPTEEDFLRISEWIKKKKQASVRSKKQAPEHNALHKHKG